MNKRVGENHIARTNNNETRNNSKQISIEKNDFKMVML